MRDLVRRLGGVVRKEVVEIVRQPGLLAILVAGPLLILLLFGSGVRAEDPAVRSIFVAPAGNAEIRELVEGYAEAQDERLTIEAVLTDRDEAMRRLEADEVQLVVVIPDTSIEELREGQRAEVEVRHSFIDPLEAQAIRLFTITAVDDINDLLVTLAIEEAQGVARGYAEEIRAADSAAEAGPQRDDLIASAEELIEQDASVLAAPFAGRAETVGGGVTTSQFYAPAVVALILQHLTLTFIALSSSGERAQRTTELFAISPLRPQERVIGKVLAYVLVGAALGAAMLAGVVLLLGAPIRGGITPVVVVLALELLAAIGVGFVLSAIARTTAQVVQGAMLLLLLSVFFGGLLLSPERLLPWARPVGWILPMTHAIPLLRDSMLRGVGLSVQPMAILSVLAVVTLAVGAWRTTREERGGA